MVLSAVNSGGMLLNAHFSFITATLAGVCSHFIRAESKFNSKVDIFELVLVHSLKVKMLSTAHNLKRSNPS